MRRPRKYGEVSCYIPREVIEELQAHRVRTGLNLAQLVRMCVRIALPTVQRMPTPHRPGENDDS